MPLWQLAMSLLRAEFAITKTMSDTIKCSVEMRRTSVFCFLSLLWICDCERPLSLCTVIDPLLRCICKGSFAFLVVEQSSATGSDQGHRAFFHVLITLIILKQMENSDSVPPTSVSYYRNTDESPGAQWTPSGAAGNVSCHLFFLWTVHQ